MASVGTASAAPSHHEPGHHHQRCQVVQGHFERTWHPATRDRHGKRHPGYWTRTWVPTHQVCER
ncbi:hypothetical protein [Streptacidiphilus rugosus]|uniref:hypothetical protein n=1 Tax=Streptacidiphilus rugosus TaxID=405783 RepID=UPI001E47D25C|nr:hypothetical protein [Streptacidiphilus rugosus]